MYTKVAVGYRHTLLKLQLEKGRNLSHVKFNPCGNKLEAPVKILLAK
jgi:hypothetical protein